MAEIINLRRVKKARARQDAAAEAEASRAAHGRTRAQVAAGEATRRETERALAAARLDGVEEP